MPSDKIFKLIVQPTETCLDLLRFLYKNIEDINALGVVVKVEKISKDELDDDLAEMFRKKGITRLPAMIAPDGFIFIGLKQIIDLFEKNLKTCKMSSRADPADSGDVSDYWMKEMYSGRDKAGKAVARQDEDDEDDESASLQRDMAKRKLGGHKKKPRAPRAPHPEDNIESDSSDDDEPIHRDAPAGVGEDAIDDKMLLAWLDKN